MHMCKRNYAFPHNLADFLNGMKWDKLLLKLKLNIKIVLFYRVQAHLQKNSKIGWILRPDDGKSTFIFLI